MDYAQCATLGFAKGSRSAGSESQRMAVLHDRTYTRCVDVEQDWGCAAGNTATQYLRGPDTLPALGTGYFDMWSSGESGV